MQKKKTTISDIAKALEITPSAVSKALNRHPRISVATREAVEKMAKQLNYQRNHLAAALRKGKSNLLGVLVPATNIQFFASVVKGIEEVANQAGYNVIIAQSNDDFDKEQEDINTLLNIRVDGIIASLANKTTSFKHFQKAKKEGVSLVLFDRVEDSLDVSMVLIDDYLGAFKATEHLVNQGYRKILHMAGRSEVPVYRKRINGYQDALSKYKIRKNKKWIIESDLKLEDGRRIMEDWLRSNPLPDAIFAASDFAALGAVQVLKERKIQIPEEVGVVGFSDEPFASFITPSLTSVNQHSEQMGNLAAQSFLDQVTNKNNGNAIPRKTVLNPELIIRDSSKRKH